MTSQPPRFGLRVVSFLAAISRSLALPILIYTAMQYGISALSKPAGEALALTVTVLGISLGLAAVCLSSTVSEQRTLQSLQYAGRHLLHASLLLLQLVFVVFAKSAVAPGGWLATVLGALLHLVAVLVLVPATWCTHYALERLNDELWAVWMEGLHRPPPIPVASDPPSQ